jgi:hypothetical protein
MMHPYVRSDRITSALDEKKVLQKASLTWTDDGRIRVLTVRGTPYERGYQHGVLLREQVRDNILTMYNNGVATFLSDELFDEAYERLRPYIPQSAIEEMHGLAHGARLPLRMVHAFHTLPSMSEWGGKKAVRDRVKGLAKGEYPDLGTSCSNFSTVGDNQFVVRILDWGLHKISKLHEYPLITIVVPEGDTNEKPNIKYANIGWIGFLGAVSGMNAQGITLGEMGYGSPPNETLRGMPMPFLLREIMLKASSLKEVRSIISSAKGENSYVFLMADGKRREAELYVRDPDRFLIFHPGQSLVEGEHNLPAIPNTVYGGHFSEKMAQKLSAFNGNVSLETIKEELIPLFAMNSNFQNVIYQPDKLQFWVNNAPARGQRASESPYTWVSLKQFLPSSSNETLP